MLTSGNKTESELSTLLIVIVSCLEEESYCHYVLRNKIMAKITAEQLLAVMTSNFSTSFFMIGDW
jgi:hypothetical protein